MTGFVVVVGAGEGFEVVLSGVDDNVVGIGVVVVAAVAGRRRRGHGSRSFGPGFAASLIRPGLRKEQIFFESKSSFNESDFYLLLVYIGTLVATSLTSNCAEVAKVRLNILEVN